jgi:hypothetical protein
VYDLGGGPALVSFEARIVFWWNDRERAVVLADTIEGLKTNAAWNLAIPMLRSFALGQAYEPAEAALVALGNRSYGARQRAFMFQLGAEYYGALGLREQTLAFLQRIDMGNFWDLGWLDHCTSLACIRDAPELAEARARTAERVSQLFA